MNNRIDTENQPHARLTVFPYRIALIPDPIPSAKKINICQGM